MSATPPETRHDEPLTIEATPFSRPEFARRQSRRSLSPVTVITGILLILLLAVTWLVFSARAVRLEFDQPTTDVTVSGGLSYLLGERYLMLTGEYQVTARAEGFHELRAPLTVTTEADQTMQFSFSPLPGILQIVSAPESGAEVFIDQQSVGITPLTIDSIEPGLHDVSLRSARFLPWDSDISIEGRRQRQTLTADLSPAWALLDISSSPAGASISIDGEAAGTTPATVEAVQGPRQITISLAGYKSWQNTLDIEAGQNQVLPEVQLIRADGKVSLSSEPAGANVTVNNDFRGITPLALSLAPGEQYRIRLTRAGYQPAERQLDLAAGDAVDLNIRLNPVVGKVRIQVTPGDATLTIDGKPAGVASQLLSLTTRPHTIVVSKPGYASFETTIVPQADVARQLIVNLQTEDEARIAAIPTEISTSAGQQLRLIYPGKLTMGADRREPGRRSNEIQKT
ncbi:MAG: PEGA domain-containing protein, partial [Pseudomonadales bacterium]|nr:PEGA domain-containing protein [Pseudomonadales bacterium]